jgi:hypothetical protein
MQYLYNIKIKKIHSINKILSNVNIYVTYKNFAYFYII